MSELQNKVELDKAYFALEQEWERTSDDLTFRDFFVKRISQLESLLKERDGGHHNEECPAGYGKQSCKCGHDAVAKYFAEVGR